MVSWLNDHDPDCDALLTQFNASYADFVQLLHGLDSVFIKKLASFVVGDVTLDDGNEHTLLASIAEQINERHIPTPAQRGAFKTVYDNLLRSKAMGKPLQEENEEARQYRVAQSNALMGQALKWRDKFKGTRTQGIIDSMNQYYQAKGILTDGQLNFLRTVVLAQVPDEKE